MGWVLQFLVLAVTALLWWLARRDLTTKAAEARTPALEDWARLHVTVEQLMVELERRAVVAEQRIYEAEQRLRLVEQRLQASLARAESAHGANAVPESPAAPVPASPPSAFFPERVLPAAPSPVDVSIFENADAAGRVGMVSGGTPLTAPLLPPGAAAPSLAVDMPLRPAAFVEAETALPALPVSEPATVPAPPASPPLTAPAPPAAPPPLPLMPEEARYQPVFALADAGQADPAEIARQTGLPRGEVELVLSLRARRTV